MTSFTFQAMCPKCGTPLLMGKGQSGQGSTITEYRCRGTKRVRVADKRGGIAGIITIVHHCGFNKVIISNEHVVSMKRRTTLSWHGLVAVYDEDYNVPANRGGI